MNHLPLMPLDSRSESHLNRRVRVIRSSRHASSNSPSHEVCYPSAFTVCGSDLHRVYLTRLCCAFRLSQPLDALFRLAPFRPYFMSVTPLGFRFQRFSPPGSHGPLDPLAPLAVSPELEASHRGKPRRALNYGPQLQGLKHPEDPSAAHRVLPLRAVAILS